MRDLKEDLRTRGSPTLRRDYLSVCDQSAGRMLVKAILMRLQIEMRNKVLETGGKAILVIKWQRTWLNCVRVLALCGRQNQ